MQPFTTHTGRAVSLPRANVDTDQIIPKQFLKRIERTGFGPALFFDWRYLPDGSPAPEFELNRPGVAGASILITGANFGCGSSREHAPWSLAEYGFRAIIAPSFADIFANNCFKNGLLPIVVDEPNVHELIRRTEANRGYKLSIDLEEQLITDKDGLSWRFEVNEFQRYCLLEGLDDIDLTLQHEAAISDYEKRLSS